MSWQRWLASRNPVTRRIAELAWRGRYPSPPEHTPIPSDQPGCGGFERYRRKLYRVAEECLALRPDLDSDIPASGDALATSPEDFRAMATYFDALHRGVETVGAPALTEEWHELVLVRLALYARCCRMAAADGLDQTFAEMGDELASLARRDADATERICSFCPAFRDFARTWEFGEPFASPDWGWVMAVPSGP